MRPNQSCLHWLPRLDLLVTEADDKKMIVEVMKDVRLMATCGAGSSSLLLEFYIINSGDDAFLCSDQAACAKVAYYDNMTTCLN